MLPGVERVERQDGTVHVYSTSLQNTSLQLFQLADENGWNIEVFRWESGSLDDLFVNMVEKEWSHDSAGAVGIDGSEVILS